METTKVVAGIYKVTDDSVDQIDGIDFDHFRISQDEDSGLWDVTLVTPEDSHDLNEWAGEHRTKKSAKLACKGDIEAQK